MGTLGVQEMVVIFLLALVLFGPKKLPELGRTIGKALTEFRRASSDLRSTFEREMQALERENDSLKEVTHQTAQEIYSHAYDYAYDEHGVSAEEHQIAPAPTTPSMVGASAVPGAESHGTIAHEATAHVASLEPAHEAIPAAPHEGAAPAGHGETASTTAVASPPVEGTVARSGAPEASQHS
jgi:sec-independent protein translocase protein TatA